MILDRLQRGSVLGQQVRWGIRRQGLKGGRLTGGVGARITERGRSLVYLFAGGFAHAVHISGGKMLSGGLVVDERPFGGGRAKLLNRDHLLGLSRAGGEQAQGYQKWALHDPATMRLCSSFPICVDRR